MNKKIAIADEAGQIIPIRTSNRFGTRIDPHKLRKVPVSFPPQPLEDYELRVCHDFTKGRKPIIGKFLDFFAKLHLRYTSQDYLDAVGKVFEEPDGSTFYWLDTS